MNNDTKKYILNYWWASNYGAILTAYALHNTMPNSLLVDNSSQLIKNSGCEFNFAEKFSNKYLNITKKYSNYTELLELGKNNGYFIVGSDQVFRPNVALNVLDSFLLNYVNHCSKKIAFSASFGVTKEQFLKENNNDTIEKMKNALKTFHLISVREKSGIEICKDILGIDAEWIIDPVFFLKKEDYDKFTIHSDFNCQDKIISYIIHSKNNKLKKINNEKIIQLARSNISVEDWLNAIKTCKILITDSFHGVCFAIIFNKPFICVTDGQNSKTRLDSLFEMLCIKDKTINNILNISADDIFEVDYTFTEKIIEKERIKAKLFLDKISGSKENIEKSNEHKIKYLEFKVRELEKQTTLKYQIKKELWNLWLIIFHKYLPEPVKNIIRKIRGSK